LYNDTCNSKEPAEIADVIAKVIRAHQNKQAGFYLFRVVWIDPTKIIGAMAALHRSNPDLNVELQDVRTFF
jgi:hypothetical protein